jgi:hypothetical protein
MTQDLCETLAAIIGGAAFGILLGLFALALLAFMELIG